MKAFEFYDNGNALWSTMTTCEASEEQAYQWHVLAWGLRNGGTVAVVVPICLN